MAPAGPIGRLPVGDRQVAFDPIDREIEQDRAMDQKMVFEPALGAAAALAAAEGQVAQSLELDGRAGRPIAAASRSRTWRWATSTAQSPGAAVSGRITLTFNVPGPTTTVPPPLERRRIGTPSARQASTKTSSRSRREAPMTTA